MKKNKIIYLDLFSGVGGFAKGFHDAGLTFKKHYFSEIDKHAIAVYKYNFKKSNYAGDIRIISKKTIKQHPNLVTFGFPCQDLSIAGRGKGLSGARSGLFFEAIRIVEEFRPEVFIFENVKGLLSNNNGEDFETVLRTIANIGLYDCEWQLVNTSWVLPQNRERIYFIGHLRGKSSPGIFPFTKSDQQFNQKHRNFATTQIASCLQSPGNACGNYKGMNAVATNLQGKEISNSIRIKGSGTYTNKHNWDTVRIKQINDKSNFGNSTKQQDKIYATDGIMACLGSHRLEDKCKIQVSPVLTPDRKVKRQNGRRFKENGEPAFTLNTQDLHGVKINNTIRRLTEIECERLQGFPDNWTQFGDYNGQIKTVCKTQRYKQLGNAVTSIIPKLIATRLIATP